MPNSSDLLAQAREVRALARQARRLAATLTSERDRVRLAGYADELEGQANDLESKAAAPEASLPWHRQHQQMQQQQQQDPSPELDEANRKK